MKAIYHQLHLINLKLDNQQAILELLLSRTGLLVNSPSAPIADVFEVFQFEKVQNKSQLQDLCANLERHEFKSKLMQMLRQNINVSWCGEDKMLAALDLMCTKEFQAECTWTGASRKGPKTAVMSHQKFVDVFMEIGNSSSEINSQEKVTAFFMKKLKNAGKRTLTSGQRRGTRRKVTRRMPRKPTETEIIVFDQNEELGGEFTMDSQ